MLAFQNYKTLLFYTLHPQNDLQFSSLDLKVVPSESSRRALRRGGGFDTYFFLHFLHLKNLQSVKNCPKKAPVAGNKDREAHNSLEKPHNAGS